MGAPLAAPLPPTAYETPEFFVNYGLSKIWSQYAYAPGSSGAGVTVAIVDTGIDVDHPEFAGRIAPASVDVVANRGQLDDVQGHGTAVAGVIGAAKNDVGMHGVAFNATILAIRADGAGGLFAQPDMASAINHAVANGARVINLSLGGAGGVGGLLAGAIANAVAQGVVIAVSSGNSGDASPLCPACLAGTGTGGGTLLAVGAVDQNNNDSGFHNRAGATANFFLVAPGVAVRTTANGGGLATVSGTSFSAPHVAGAAAVLMQLFPHLSGAQVADILLGTATDLGQPGTDDVFGRGLLNLDDAVAPLGALGIPLEGSVSGARADAAATRLRLGPAFGDALSHHPALGVVAALDDYDRPYAVDLRARVAAAPRTLDLAAHLRDEARTASLTAPGGGLINLRFADAGGDGQRRILGHDLTLDLSPETRLRAADDVRALDGAGALRAAQSMFRLSGDLFDPGAEFVAKGQGLSIAQAIDTDSTVTVGWLRSDGRMPDSSGIGWLPGMRAEDLARPGAERAGQGRTWLASFERRYGSGAAIGFKWSFVIEDQDALGSSGAGAFDFSGGARSHFADISWMAPISRNWDAFGRYTRAVTAMPAGGGLLRDWSRVDSDSFALGIVGRGIFAANDRAGLMIGQPLRALRAPATLKTPVARELGDNVVVSEQRVDLTPSGRERDVALSYGLEMAPGVEFTSQGVLRLEPGHVAGAGKDLGLLLGLRVAF